MMSFPCTTLFKMIIDSLYKIMTVRNVYIWAFYVQHCSSWLLISHIRLWLYEMFIYVCIFKLSLYHLIRLCIVRLYLVSASPTVETRLKEPRLWYVSHLQYQSGPSMYMHIRNLEFMIDLWIEIVKSPLVWGKKDSLFVWWWIFDWRVYLIFDHFLVHVLGKWPMFPNI